MWGDISLLFWFEFPWWSVMLSIFCYNCWPFICCLWKKCSFKSFAHILIRLFVCYWVVGVPYILEINPLSDMWFANYFSTGSIPLVTFSASFAVQKFLRLCSPLVSFYFCCLFWYHIQENIAKINVIKPFPYVFFQEF